MIKVLKSGFYSTIQDLGRFGFVEYGVPISGAMDQYTSKLANLILGNEEGKATLEITISGPTLQFNCSTTICITGADLSPKLNGLTIRLNKAICIETNDVLSFGKMKYGCRAYLAVLGGFKPDYKMGSFSMYQNITYYSKISKNGELQIEQSDLSPSSKAAIRINDDHFKNEIINVYKGPEFDLLQDKTKKKLLSQQFIISNLNNRMAYQLKEKLPNNLKSIITSLVVPGTVQLTPAGNIIILMRDCQTTGGYPRILQLTESAINSLSQKFTDDKIHFSLVE